MSLFRRALDSLDVTDELVEDSVPSIGVGKSEGVSDLATASLRLIRECEGFIEASEPATSKRHHRHCDDSRLCPYAKM